MWMNPEAWALRLKRTPPPIPGNTDVRPKFWSSFRKQEIAPKCNGGDVRRVYQQFMNYKDKEFNANTPGASVIKEIWAEMERAGDSSNKEVIDYCLYDKRYRAHELVRDNTTPWSPDEIRAVGHGKPYVRDVRKLNLIIATAADPSLWLIVHTETTPENPSAWNVPTFKEVVINPSNDNPGDWRTDEAIRLIDRLGFYAGHDFQVYWLTEPNPNQHQVGKCIMMEPSEVFQAFLNRSNQAWDAYTMGQIPASRAHLSPELKEMAKLYARSTASPDTNAICWSWDQLQKANVKEEEARLKGAEVQRI